MKWLNKGHEFWDQTLLKELLKDLPKTEREVIVVPGTINIVEEVNEILSQYPKVLVIVTSDEENKFPIDKLKHPDMIRYVQYANPDKHYMVERYLPIGFSPMEKVQFTPKKLNWFFAGQVNHDSRIKMAEVLRELSGGKLVESAGFAQGLKRKDYFQQMEYASVVPSPSGPLSPDSFRTYEALELGAVPITDRPEFWRLLFDEVPFPTIPDWKTLPDLINNIKDRQELNNTCMAWWLRMKRQFRYHLEDDLGVSPSQITVLIPTSPIESHPSTETIEETIKSIRERLPDSEIIIMIDGVRDEQAHHKSNYIEYTRNLLWKCNHEWQNIYPLVFESHQHQANITREALRHVRTPTVLFMEHDTPLTGEIPFNEMVGAIQTGKVNLIRFHYEAQVHPEHKHLMLDTEPQIVNGVPLLRCAQWSQRPHLASTGFYMKILEAYFPPTSRTMIEDLIYGILENAWFNRKTAGWNDFRVWMYAPDGDIKRSLNLDGRGDESKYEMKFL